jgi:hypothetical protein
MNTCSGSVSSSEEGEQTRGRACELKLIGRGGWRQRAPRCCGLALRQDRTVALAVLPGAGALDSRGWLQLGSSGPRREAPCRLCSASPCRPSAQALRQALLCQLLACEDTRIEERPAVRRALAALGEPLGGRQSAAREQAEDRHARRARCRRCGIRRRPRHGSACFRTCSTVRRCSLPQALPGGAHERFARVLRRTAAARRPLVRLCNLNTAAADCHCQ